MPFIASNKGGQSNTYHGNFGDFAVAPRFLLSESQDLTQIVALHVSTPTGSTVNGNGQTRLPPIRVLVRRPAWRWGDPGRHRPDDTDEQRGGHLEHRRGPHDRPWGPHHVHLRPGRREYWTQHDATPGDFVTFLSINGFTTLDDRGPIYSYLSFTPALRFHLGNDYYFVAGIEVPMTGPKNQNFTWAPNFWLTEALVIRQQTGLFSGSTRPSGCREEGREPSKQDVRGHVAGGRPASSRNHSPRAADPAGYWPRLTDRLVPPRFGPHPPPSQKSMKGFTKIIRGTHRETRRSAAVTHLGAGQNACAVQVPGTLQSWKRPFGCGRRRKMGHLVLWDHVLWSFVVGLTPAGSKPGMEAHLQCRRPAVVPTLADPRAGQAKEASLPSSLSLLSS